MPIIPQYEKLLSPILVTLIGITISTRLLHPLNASSQISLKPVKNCNSSKLEIAAYEKNADETASIMQILIENCESVSDFTKSLLFSHLKFSQLDKEFISNFQQDLIKRFCDEEAFDYMKGNEYWESLAKND